MRHLPLFIYPQSVRGQVLKCKLAFYSLSPFNCSGVLSPSHSLTTFFHPTLRHFLKTAFSSARSLAAKRSCCAAFKSSKEASAGIFFSLPPGHIGHQRLAGLQSRHQLGDVASPSTNKVVTLGWDVAPSTCSICLSHLSMVLSQH